MRLVKVITPLLALITWEGLFVTVQGQRNREVVTTKSSSSSPSVTKSIASSSSVKSTSRPSTSKKTSSSSDSYTTKTKTKTHTKSTITSKKSSSTSSASINTSTCSYGLCSTQERLTITFDDLPVATSVPDNYPAYGFRWSGWTVQDSSSLAINSSSEPNLVQSNSIAPGITYDPQEYNYAYPYYSFSVESFDFACVTYEYPYGTEATPCEIALLYGQDSGIFGPYAPRSYVAPLGYVEQCSEYGCPNCGPGGLATCNMTHLSVDAGQLDGTHVNYLNFFIVSGKETASLVIDNVVVILGFENA